MLNEWIHEASSRKELLGFVSQFDSETRAAFNVDLSHMNWPSYSMNCAYGLKLYILHEEAAMPSRGYNDVVVRMKDRGWSDLLPWSVTGQPAQARSRDDMTRLILSQDTVKKEMALLVKQKLEYYKGELHLDVTEDKVYREVEKSAIVSI